MIQIPNYPINIIYSKNNQEYYDRNTPPGTEEFPDREAAEVAEDDMKYYSSEVAHYTIYVKKMVNYIGSTAIGQLLLGMLDPNVKVWIMPDPRLTNRAMTFPPPAGKEQNGIRIHINMEDWKKTFDDTLFHELVHALRISNKRFYNVSMYSENYPGVDEFLATQMTNIYRSYHGRKQLYPDYWTMEDQWSNKGDIYSSLIEEPMTIIVLKYFLDSEEFAKKVAHLKRPSYNPFRDYPILERMALGKIGGGKFVKF